MERQFKEIEIQMALEHVKRYLFLIEIKKPKLRYLSCIRLAKQKCDTNL